MNKSVQVTLDATADGDALKVSPWLVTITRKENGIEWHGTRCRIKIELDHPEHFISLHPSGYAASVVGTLADSAPNGTYHYGISVLGKDKPHPDDTTETVTDAYTIDPDYKVDR